MSAGFSPTDTDPYAADGGPVGAVLCHGFTGMPGSMRPWGEALAGAGLTVRIPRLPGHGTRWQDANRSTWQEWYAALDSAVDEVRGRCTSTFVMGLSMGATLTIRLAEQRGHDLAGIVLVNPSLFTTRKDAKLLPVMRHVIPSLKGIGSDIKKPGVVEPAYPRTPLQAAYQLSLLWRATNADLAKVNTPMLVMTSREDHVVEPGNAERLMTGVSSADKRQIWLEDSYHVATLDNDLPRIIDESLSFVRSHSPAVTPEMSRDRDLP
ncbi:MAG TPA: alpha/beta fold hydrolase [Mycobacteriales bacterium]|nr:alpha/beta fold hydrolase [Mycobacteriales bacterium]